jgi:hypothetical protein
MLCLSGNCHAWFTSFLLCWRLARVQLQHNSFVSELPVSSLFMSPTTRPYPLSCWTDPSSQSRGLDCRLHLWATPALALVLPLIVLVEFPMHPTLQKTFLPVSHCHFYLLRWSRTIGWDFQATSHSKLVPA